MKDDNANDEEILKALKPDYSNQEIDDAFNQSSQDGNILDELDQFEPSKEQQDAPEDLLEEAPSPEGEEPSLRYTQSNTGYNQPAPELGSSQIQEIVESIVEEKWDDLISKIGDVNLWKESVNNDLEAVKQEILRVQEKFNNLQIVGTDERGDSNLDDYNFDKPTILLVGNETWGLSVAYKELCDAMIKIPMSGSASSLNVSCASSIMLYEIFRQRGFGDK